MSDQAPTLKCAECQNGHLVLRFSAKWGGRRFYDCTNFPRCKGAIGAHRMPPYKPLGTPANPETKALRIQVHDVLDPLWKTNKWPGQRKRIYAWLSVQLVTEYHTGNCDANQCRRVLELLKDKTPEFFRDLHTQRKESDHVGTDAPTE